MIWKKKKKKNQFLRPDLQLFTGVLLLCPVLLLLLFFLIQPDLLTEEPSGLALALGKRFSVLIRI